MCKDWQNVCRKNLKHIICVDVLLKLNTPKYFTNLLRLSWPSLLRPHSTPVLTREAEREELRTKLWSWNWIQI